MPWPFGGLFHGLAVEFSLSPDDIEQFPSRNDGKEPGMIVGLELLDFKLYPVDVGYYPLATLLVGRPHPFKFAHLSEKSPLLGVHFIVEGEELGSLCRCEASLNGNEFLEVGLEFLWVESTIVLSHRRHCQRKHHQNEGETFQDFWFPHFIHWICKRINHSRRT